MKRLVLIVALAFASGCAQEIIAHLQEERDSNRIVYLLDKEGIEAQKIRDEKSRELRFNLAVDADKKTMALAILERENLPKATRVDTAAVFQEGGLIPTNLQERKKAEVGVAGDIENKLRRFDGIVEVAATVSIPQENPLRDINEKKPRPKAAVMITFKPDGDNRAPVSVEDVQRFASAALPELLPAEVSVTMNPSRMHSPSTGGSGTGGGAAPAPIAANACEKTAVIGVEICGTSKKKLYNYFIGVIVLTGLLSGMAVIAVFRALRYRKDLTRMTAQFNQLRK